MDREDVTPQDVAFAGALAGIANPVRLALLRHLRTPRAMKEIRVGPAPTDPAVPAERSASRQTLKAHLDKLLEGRAVVARDVERSYGSTTEYVVDHQALFAWSEELRDLARLRPAAEIDAPTRETPPGRPLHGGGPCLVLVKGIEEGRAFPLAVEEGARREWLIGRRRGLAVTLDYDPFVSHENTIVSWDAGRFSIASIPEARNGTLVNFQPLAPGKPRPLLSGDLVTVGRSALLFRA